MGRVGEGRGKELKSSKSNLWSDTQVLEIFMDT